MLRCPALPQPRPRPRLTPRPRHTRPLTTTHSTAGAPPQSTVNAAEIAHFSRLASLWWDERGEFALLHRMNPARVQFVREKLLEVAREEEGEGADDVAVLRGKDVLDVGCGGGILSESLARLGGRTLGVDASDANIRIALLHASADPHLSTHTPNGGTLAYRHASAEALVQEQRRFDIVCSMEVVEHVDNPAAFLASCAELVKPGGHLFLSTVARTPLAYLLTILAAEHILRLVAPGTHTYSKFVNPSELIDFFAKYPSPPSPVAHPPSPAAPPTTRPWISRTYAHGQPARTEAEVRGLVYVPLGGRWVLMPRAATPWAAECNYLFWVRKPRADAS